jgi:hypothetical protein
MVVAMSVARALASRSQLQHLTLTEQRCMEAYFALVQRMPASDIGSEEIRRFFREFGKGRPPGNSTVLGALRKTGVEHRKAGMPFGGRARLDAIGSCPSGSRA